MSLLPVDVLYVHRVTPYNSADCPVFIAGSDSQDYVAKLAMPDNPCQPLAEALAYYLCARIGVAVPATAFLRFPDGRVAFGSRYESGVAQFTQLDPAARIQALNACKSQIAALCLIDAFAANPDRHLDNLLFRISPLDGRWTVLGMDFSRAFWRHGFPATSAHSIFQQGNTAALVNILHAFKAFDASLTASVVASLQTITAPQLSAWIDSLPSGYVCDEALGLAAWWASEARLARMETLLELLP